MAKAKFAPWFGKKKTYKLDDKSFDISKTSDNEAIEISDGHIHIETGAGRSLYRQGPGIMGSGGRDAIMYNVRYWRDDSLPRTYGEIETRYDFERAVKSIIED